MIEIDSVTISTIEDRRVRLGETFARQLAIGTGWTDLCIGMRIAREDIGGDFWYSPFIALGIQSAPNATLSNNPNTDTTGHFVGLCFTAALDGANYSHIRDATGNPLRGYCGLRARTKVLTAYVESATSGISKYYSLAPASARCIWMLKFRKIGATIAVSMISPSGSVVDSCKDTTKSELSSALAYYLTDTSVNTVTYINTVLLHTGAGWNGYTYTDWAAVAVNEALNGDLNSFVFSWAYRAVPFYISDVYYAYTP